MNDNDKLIKLRKFLEDKGITQKEIAALFGVHESFVNQLLTGKKQFGKKVARRWSDHFGISYTWLLTGEGEMMPPVITQNVNGGENITQLCDINSGKAIDEIAAQRKMTEQALERLKVSQQQISDLIEVLKKI